jgi:hypothetical protein
LSCRFDELGKEWRFPAKKDWIPTAGGGHSATVDSPTGARDLSTANGHWERDKKGNRKWVTTESGESAHGRSAHKAGAQEMEVSNTNGPVQDAPRKQQKSPKVAAASQLSVEDRIRQEEGMRLEQIGIKTGVEVDIRLEWPPGQGRKKWVSTTVRRVSKKKGYFKTELDADTEQEGGMRFYVGEMDSIWRFPKLSSSAGSSKAASAKQNAVKEMDADGAGQEPYVGARIEVLFDVDGQQDWYGGKIVKKEKQAGKWLVRFDDGDEESIIWPDPKGEVRICSVKTKRSSALPNKEENEGKAERGKNAQGSLLRLHVGDLCRVLFDDGIRYLGVVTGKDLETNESIIVFEDGEEHRVVLPDKDVFEASRDEALAQWVEEHGETKAAPWWCAHPIVHPFEDGEFDVDVPDNWSRVLIHPPVKPKRKSGKSQKKAKETVSSESVDSTRVDAGGDQEMVDEADGADKKKSAKRQAKGFEDAGGEEAGKDVARSKDNKQKKKDAMEVEGQGQAGERPQKKGSRPRDRAAERRRREESQTLSKAQSQYLTELESLLLQETPDEVIDDEDITDFVDAWCVYMPQTEALNHKDFCLMCGSSPTKEEVLFCRDCGECFHHACAVNSKQRKIPKEKRHMWRCPACRICEVCNGEENWESMLICDGCDRGFHTYCLKPALRAIPDGGWKCNDCVQCVSCGLKQVGTRKDIWRKDCTMCVTCFLSWDKGSYCPICKVVWTKEEKNHRAVMCDTCNKWVHPRCGGFDDAKYKEMEAMMEAGEPVEWNCPKCTGDLEVSDEEENDKKYVLPSGNTVIEVQRQLEEFCRDKIKMLQRTCEAIERAFNSGSPHIAHAVAEAHAEASPPPERVQVEEQAEMAGHQEARPAADISSVPHQDAAGTTTATSSSLQSEHGNTSASAMECDESAALGSAAASEKAGIGAKSLSIQPAADCGEGAKISPEDSAPNETESEDDEKDEAKEAAVDRLVRARKQTDRFASGKMEGQKYVSADNEGAQNGAAASEKDEAAASAPPDKNSLSHAALPQSEAPAQQPAGTADMDMESQAETSRAETSRAETLQHAALPCAPAERKASATIGAMDAVDHKMEALKTFAASNVEDQAGPARVASDVTSKVEGIAVAEFEAAAEKCTPDERVDKLVGLARLKKDLVKLEKAIDKHKYKELVPFFDDIIGLLSDDERFGSIPKEVQRLRACTKEAMPDAAKRSRLVGLPAQQPQLVGADRQWARQDQLATANNHANFLQQMLPSMQEFGLPLAHSPAGGYQYDARPLQLPASSMRDMPPVQKKKPVQKPMQHAYGSGVVGDGVGGRQPLTRQPLAASGRLLSLMSTFYGRLKHSHEHNPTVHDKLLLHFQNSDWPHMTIEKLKAFVETTFKGQTAILNAFYEVFREHLPAEEPKTATPQQEHAAWFCAEVRRMYGPTSPTYKGFIETMNNYAKKDKDTLGTIRAIKNLFTDSPNLIVEFANFVPETYKKHCTMDKRPGKRKAVDQRSAGGASAAGTALLAATSPSSIDAQSGWQGKIAAQQASGDSMQPGSRQAAQALVLAKSEHDRALGIIAQCEATGALTSAEAAAQRADADAAFELAKVSAGSALAVSLHHEPGVAQEAAHQSMLMPLQHSLPRQQQQEMYAKFQELLKSPGPDAKKKRGSDADSLVASAMLRAGGHSLSAMSEEYQRQQQQQQQQQALMQQVQRHQQQPATSQQQQQQLQHAAAIQNFMQDPRKALQNLEALTAIMTGGKVAGAGVGAGAGTADSSSLRSGGASLLQTSASKPALGVQGSMPPLLPAGPGTVTQPQPSQLAALMQMLQTQSSGQKLGQAGHTLASAVSSASVLTGAAGSAVGSPIGMAKLIDAAQAMQGGLPSLSSVLMTSSAHAQPVSQPGAAAQASLNQLLTSILHNGAASGHPTEGSARSIPQMDGECLEEVQAHGSLPQLDGADVDIENDDNELVPPVADDLVAAKADLSTMANKPIFKAPALELGEVGDGDSHDIDAGAGSRDTRTQGQGFSLTQDAASRPDDAEGADSGRRGKRISKANIKPGFMTEEQIKESAKASKGESTSSYRHQDQLEMKRLIQQAAEKPSSQEVQITGRVIRQPNLLAAIRERGMDDGSIVWAQVATCLGIDIRRCHNYSQKLLQLLEGRVGESEDRKKSSKASRPKADKSKGISKRPAPKPKVPIILSSRMAQTRSLEAESKDQSSIRQTAEGGYVTLKLLTGLSNSSRDEFVHFLPKKDETKPKVHREGGVLARKYSVRRAAAQAQRLWVQTILDSVKRSTALQERLNRQRMAKLTNVEGWDKKRLGRLIEAAAVGLGLFYWSQAQLCYANLRSDRLAELGVLSEDKERSLRRSLGQVHREINKDPRLCCLCRIVGDSGVQGRLLYVERETWAHVNCLCWSKNVYELGIHRNKFSKVTVC